MKTILPKNKQILAVLFFTTLALSLNLKPAKAQTTTLPLVVAPARQELTVDPGKTTAINLRFLNQAAAPVSGPIKVADFIVEDKEGSPLFLEGPTALSSRFAASSWFTLPYDRMTIAAKGTVNIQAKINVPQDAAAGGRYVAIYFEPGGEVEKATNTPKEAASPVTIRLAGLIYLRVSGPISEGAFLSRFSAPRFVEYGPIPVTSEILNQGNYHIRPKGAVTMTNLLGQQVDQQVIREQNIFPEVSRVFENQVGKKWMFGKYKLELAASYGESGQVLTGTIITWVFPWKVITAVMLAIIIAILLVSQLYTRTKKREEQLEKKIEKLEEKLEEVEEKK